MDYEQSDGEKTAGNGNVVLEKNNEDLVDKEDEERRGIGQSEGKEKAAGKHQEQTMEFSGSCSKRQGHREGYHLERSNRKKS